MVIWSQKRTLKNEGFFTFILYNIFYLLSYRYGHLVKGLGHFVKDDGHLVKIMMVIWSRDLVILSRKRTLKIPNVPKSYINDHHYYCYLIFINIVKLLIITLKSWHNDTFITTFNKFQSFKSF